VAETLADELPQPLVVDRRTAVPEWISDPHDSAPG
jgi:hypothetical protein